MMPPARLSVIASARNCISTSRLRAPTAMRRPISRVRSVTETSMMFMMPMPPTSSETPATLASSAVIVRLDRSSDPRHLRERDFVEIRRRCPRPRAPTSG